MLDCGKQISVSVLHWQGTGTEERRIEKRVKPHIFYIDFVLLIEL